MSAVAVYNGFGKYETRDNEKGIVLKYGGVDFWFPYKKVTYLPDYTFHEVDHDLSTPKEGEEGVLVYRSFRISGERLAEELLETQVPVPNKDKGFVVLSKANRIGTSINVHAGITEEGARQTAEVHEVKLSESDVQLAERLSYAYKKMVVEEYFQSKRERMAGGHGRLKAEGLVKAYMEELGVKDIDSLPSQNAGNPNLEQLLTQLLTRNAAAPVTPQVGVPTQGVPAKQQKGSSAEGLV